MTSLLIRVAGLPAPQGSKKHVGNGVMVESSKRVKPWRAAVEAAARQAIDECPEFGAPVDRGVMVETTFYLPRPKAHYRTGRRAGEKREDAPTYVTTMPDVEKLVRSTHDGLTKAGVWVDDARAVLVVAAKQYAHPGRTGAVIEISPLG